VSPELVSEPPPADAASPQLELGIEDTYANTPRKTAG
jgi:hypothetical protein